MEIGRKRRENDSGKGVVWRKQAKALAAGRTVSLSVVPVPREKLASWR
jgi:hypothetical protein